MLPSCENIGTCTVKMIAANMVLFVGLWWIWQKRFEGQRGSMVAFPLFMGTFTLFIASAVLAALGKTACRLMFCLGCISNVPLVFSVWMFIKGHSESCERLEIKASSKGENTPQPKRKLKRKDF